LKGSLSYENIGLTGYKELIVSTGHKNESKQ